MKRILLIRSAKPRLVRLEEKLRASGFLDVVGVDDPDQALGFLHGRSYELVVIPFDDDPAWEVVLSLAARSSYPVVYTDQGDPETAVRAVHLGAKIYADSQRETPEAMARRILAVLSGETEEAISLESRERIERLEHEARQFRLLFDHMGSGFAYHRIVLDEDENPADFIFLQANSAFEEMTGLHRTEVLGRPVSETQPGFVEHDYEWIRIYGEVALTGRPIRFERYSENLGRWLLVRAYSPEPYHFATVFDDVSERKRAEQEMRSSLLRKTTLLREIHHRVKNNMQIVASLLNLELGRAKESPELVLRRSQERIHSMALIHELLYRSADLTEVELTEYFREIGEEMVEGHQPESRIRLGGASLSIPGEQAFAVGLVVTEALSNAITHGAGGEIAVTVSELDGEVEVTVADTGPGFNPDVAVTPRSLGYTLMREMAAQIGGSISVENGTGARVTLRFPLEKGR